MCGADGAGGERLVDLGHRVEPRRQRQAAASGADREPGPVGEPPRRGVPGAGVGRAEPVQRCERVGLGAVGVSAEPFQLQRDLFQRLALKLADVEPSSLLQRRRRRIDQAAQPRRVISRRFVASVTKRGRIEHVFYGTGGG